VFRKRDLQETNTIPLENARRKGTQEDRRGERPNSIAVRNHVFKRLLTGGGEEGWLRGMTESRR